jgi:MHS family shikimate/dehydroshikimate transporter-like MFS transporter
MEKLELGKQTLGISTITETSTMRKIVTAGAIGSALEWYDFYIYGMAAALVFNKLFFPNVSPTIGTLAAFGSFGLGFFARPIGGIVFSHYGDKIGRKSVLIITLLLMGGATTLIGLLPTYQSIGIWAPILLVLMRLIQGFGSGAELGGAVLMAVESSTPARRGFSQSFIFIGVQVGLLVSSSIFYVFSNTLSDAQFMSWGWRVPFLLSSVLVVVGFYIRTRISESPAFAEIKKKQKQVRIPVVELLRTERKSLLVVIGARMAENGLLYLYSVFLVNYISKQLHLSSGIGTAGMVIASALGIVTIPFFANLSDKIGRRPLLIGGAAFSALAVFPIFWMIDTQSSVLITIALILGISISWGAMVSVQGVYLAELFPTHLRYSGFTFGREISSLFAGGIAPFIATALLAWSGGASWPVAIYALTLALIALVALCFGPETYKKDISN